LGEQVFQHQPAVPAPTEPKAAFRAWVRQVRKGLNARDLGDIGAACEGVLWGLITDNCMLDHDRSLMVYVPIRGELDPILLASHAISAGWVLCIGRGSSTTSPLHAVAVNPAFVGGGSWHRDGCDTDAWGMPVPRDHVPVRPGSLAAVLVPGQAFDERGQRLGRGAGVYDRFLASLPPSVLRVAMSPEALIVPQLPTDPHDVPMHFVVTERRVIAGEPVRR
jgi:5-formyltetrahydrofolate cyclo-ligase